MRTLICEELDTADESTDNSRWMVSFADFMTLLFAVMVVLVAQQAVKAAQESTPVAQAAAGNSIVALPELASESRRLSVSLSRALAALVESGDVLLVQKKDGLLIEVRDTALFASGAAVPSAQASDVIARIASVLRTSFGNIRVEGHTDDVPIATAQYPSNWELSSARAAAVVRALQAHGIAASRLSAIGLADTQPRASNETPEGRSQNRRVTLFISAQS